MAYEKFLSTLMAGLVSKILAFHHLLECTDILH